MITGAQTMKRSMKTTAVPKWRDYMYRHYGPNYWEALPADKRSQQEMVDRWGLALLAEGLTLRSAESYVSSVLSYLGISRRRGEVVSR